jgi:uncharacterized protein YjbJ (UPF0337 family)
MNAQSDQVKGHAKSVAGIVTGNQELQDEGAAQTRAGEAAASIDAARDKAADVLDKVKDALDHAADKAKDSLHRP